MLDEWPEKTAQREEADKKIDATPVHVETVDAAGLKKLRANPSGHITLIDFWATWCGSCLVEFSDLQDTYRMYSARDFDLVTVSANMPDEQPSVLRFLQKKHATSRNLLLDPTIRRHSKQPSIQRGNRRFPTRLCSGRMEK